MKITTANVVFHFLLHRNLGSLVFCFMIITSTVCTANGHVGHRFLSMVGFSFVKFNWSWDDIVEEADLSHFKSLAVLASINLKNLMCSQKPLTPAQLFRKEWLLKELLLCILVPAR